MDRLSAKVELMQNHYRHALDQLCGHYGEERDIDGLLDVGRVAEYAVEMALTQIKPQVRLQQQVEIDDGGFRVIG